LSAGLTRINARIGFSDGLEKDTQPADLRVEPPEAPPSGSVIIAQGEAALEPSPGDGVTPADFRRFIPFTTPTAGRIDVAVDWTSPLNKVDFAGFVNHCNSAGTCGRLIFSSGFDNVKPLTESTHQPGGEYTLRIDNLGPDHETVRYEVRFTPSSSL
jgi:hypothetical protein